jgi:hypothetical protein
MPLILAPNHKPNEQTLFGKETGTKDNARERKTMRLTLKWEPFALMGLRPPCPKSP